MKFGLFSHIFYKTFLSLGLLPVLSLFFISLNVSAADPNFTIYKQCWKFETDKLSGISPAVNSSSLVFSLSDATLLNLDSLTGNVNWRTELGGEITAPPISSGNIIVAATRTSSTENEKNTNQLTVRALSSATGVTIWQRNFPSAERIFLVSNDKTVLLAVNESETAVNLINLEMTTGNALWSKNLPSAVTTNFYQTQTQIYFGTKDNSIYSIRAWDGESVKRYKIKNAAAHIAAANGIIFFDDVSGGINAVRESDSQQIWALRTGGAVQDILPTERGLLVSSLDNFVYLHKYSNGEREWRRRLAARPLSTALLNRENAIVLVNGESSAVVLELKKGKILNQILLGANNYPVAPPEIADKLLFIPTFNGLLCYAPDNVTCGKPPKPEKVKSAE